MSDAVMPIIVWRDVHKTFGDAPVLRGVTLAVAPASVHYILGVSGAGKSVLVRHVVGLCRADRGMVLFEGENVAVLSEKQFALVRRRCQLVFQHSTLFEHLTVRDNVAMPLARRFDLLAAAARRQADALLERLQLMPFADRLAGELGAGVQKRVATARALGMRPHVLLYDEPTTGLDPVAARRTDRLIDGLRREGVTQVVVSHDMVSARAVAERITFLHAGRVYFDGPAARFWELLDDPVLQAFTAPPPVLAPRA